MIRHKAFFDKDLEENFDFVIFIFTAFEGSICPCQDAKNENLPQKKVPGDLELKKKFVKRLPDKDI